MAIEFKDNATFGDLYSPAMSVKTKKGAEEYLTALVVFSMKAENKKPKTKRRTESEIESIHRGNIGYWTGYYDAKVARRVLRVFGTAHPIFGHTRPDAKTAMETGMRIAKRFGKRRKTS